MNAKITYSLLSSTDIKSCTFNLSPEKKQHPENKYANFISGVARGERANCPGRQSGGDGKIGVITAKWGDKWASGISRLLGAEKFAVRPGCQ